MKTTIALVFVAAAILSHGAAQARGRNDEDPWFWNYIQQQQERRALQRRQEEMEDQRQQDQAAAARRHQELMNELRQLRQDPYSPALK